MPTIDISQFEDSIVLHFGIDGHTINAYTLASTLVSMADAAKRANAAINTGYDIEVVVEALGEGSFRAKLRAIYTKTRENLFSQATLHAMVFGILANYIYERTLSKDSDITVIVEGDTVIVEQGETKIIIPKKVHEATRQVEKDSAFRGAVSKTFEAVDSDPAVRSFGIVKNMEDPPPPVEIPRNKFAILVDELGIPDPRRVITEEVELQIIKAILQRSKRKWEFVWRGNVISAPILDENFYEEFFSRSITIAPGDTLKVTLEIAQVLQQDIDIYTNRGYQIVKVHEHVPRPRQTQFENTES